ncbi:MAG: mandelate racemase/muconate lactonizing enzyme family protein [Nitrososphaeria archaeon]
MIGLKISDVRIYSVKGRHWPRFPWLFVEIETSNGLQGFGEALAYKSTGVRESLEVIGKKIIGRDPLEVELIWQELFREGFSMPAVSGIEIALMDILGKHLNTPVYNLLGGKCRSEVQVYVDGFFRGARYVEEEYVEKALAAVREGFKVLKMDVDEPIPSGKSVNRTLSPEDLKYTVRMVEAVRNAVGEDVQLAIDCHGAFDVNTALNLVKGLEPYNLMWVEDPVPQNNLEAMSFVSRSTIVPICTGELLNTRWEFRELFELRAARIIMPDVARTGGILELKKIASMAETYYIPVAPHNMVGPIATIASVQVCASIPNLLLLEYQLGDVEWRDKILDRPINVEGGKVTVPHGPGLGVNLKRDVLEDYLVV